MPVRFPAVLLPALLVASTSHAITSFTTAADFEASLPSTPGIGRVDFEGLSPGSLLPSGTSIGGITFTYSIDGLTMRVTDRFDTTSPRNSLGLTGGDDAFLDGDPFTLTFDQPLFALGLSFITSDPVLPGEIQIVTSEGTVLGSGVPEEVLADGGIVYFLGLTGGSVSSALIDFAADGEVNFVYNVDDIVTQVPEPWTLLLAGAGVIALGAWRRHTRRQSR